MPAAFGLTRGNAVGAAWFRRLGLARDFAIPVPPSACWAPKFTGQWGNDPKDTLSNGILPPVTTAIVARSPRPSSESGNPCTNEAHGLLLPSTRQHTSEGCTIPCHLRYLAACRRLPKLRMTVLASVFPGAFKQMVLNEAKDLMLLTAAPCVHSVHLLHLGKRI